MNTSRYFILTAFFGLLSQSTFANAMSREYMDASIDGFLFLVLIVGVVYGAFKLKQEKQQSKVKA